MWRTVAGHRRDHHRVIGGRRQTEITEVEGEASYTRRRLRRSRGSDQGEFKEKRWFVGMENDQKSKSDFCSGVPFNAC